MNTRPTETRPPDDLRLQIELERLLAARRAEEVARATRYRRVSTPRSQFRADARAPMADFRRVPPAPLPRPARMSAKQIIAAAIVWGALFAFGLWLAAHDPGALSRTVEQLIGGAA
jgi:hypothetical protein